MMSDATSTNTANDAPMSLDNGAGTRLLEEGGGIIALEYCVERGVRYISVSIEGDAVRLNYYPSIQAINEAAP